MTIQKSTRLSAEVSVNTMQCGNESWNDVKLISAFAINESNLEAHEKYETKLFSRQSGVKAINVDLSEERKREKQSAASKAESDDGQLKPVSSSLKIIIDIAGISRSSIIFDGMRYVAIMMAALTDGVENESCKMPAYGGCNR